MIQNQLVLSAIALLLAFIAEYQMKVSGAVLATALSLLIWYWAEVLLMIRWLNRGMHTPVPKLSYPMRVIANRIVQQRDRARKRKKRLQRIIMHFRDLSEMMSEATIVVDESGNIASFNDAAERLLSLNRDLDIGNSIDYVIRAEKISSIWQALDLENPLIVRLISEPSRYIEFLRIPLHQNYALLIFRDMTELHHLERKRKAFVDNASHELRTPLTVLRGFIDLLMLQPVPEEWQMSLQEMQRHALHMQTLLDDMLELAMLDESEIPLHEQVIQVRSFIDELVQDMNRQYPKSIGVRVGEVDNCFIRADKNLLHSMLRNLIENGIVHSKSCCPVEINALVADEFFVISVNDDGMGIAAEHIPHLTERFYRVDRARKNSSGSGLGLAIVKHAVQAHGGTLMIESELNQGTSFIIRLPVARVLSHIPN